MQTTNHPSVAQAEIDRAQRPPTFVVGWDASAASRAALAVAARLAHRGAVVVVHAYGASAPEATTHWQELLREDAADRSAALLRQIPHQVQDIAAVESRSVAGAPLEALIEAAADADADAIVVGSRGLGEAGELLGSVSSALLRAADRPVLVVPAGAR